jgi:NADH-quinone oxidoreductase subunit J
MSAMVAIVAGGLAVVAALLAVTSSDAVRSLFALLAALLTLAAAFFALGADFAGALQILIYAGAVAAVFVFVVMTITNSDALRAAEHSRLRRVWPVPAAVAILIVLMFLPALRGAKSSAAVGAAIPVRAVGALLFGPWAVVVELASFLLLAAMLGARHLGRRAPSPPPNEPLQGRDGPS